MTIVEFLTARLDEDERLARAATPGPWSPDAPFLSDVVTSALLGPVADCAIGTDYRAQSLEDACHIARHDPARVLAEVAAKRSIIALHAQVDIVGPGGEDMAACGACGDTTDEYLATCWPCDTLKHLAAPYADHPDYDPTWADPA